MQVYKYVGSGGGLPGLPHRIVKSAGDKMLEEFEEALKEESGGEVDPQEQYQAYRLPGFQLKSALESKVYKLYKVKDTEKPKDAPASSEEKPEKENK